MITGRTGDFFETVRYVRLGSEIKLHVSIDREAVETFLADAPPLTIRLHEPLIDAKARLLADRAFRVTHPAFDLLDCQCGHKKLSIRREYGV